ncbi:MAG TPA: Na+/H+ antiporter [Humisphaera sp.]|jgi:CPA1 family monovalent cation:H+ antiporter|nr:Na+/H+ antiporter [Humisphaera sp.]
MDHATETIIGLLAAAAAFVWLAARIRVPYPVMLVAGGLALGFIPHLPRPDLQPDLIFLLFLPPLLYYPALLTSWRDFRSNLQPISMLAVGLVLFTMVVVAMLARLLAPELSWPAAFVLGAIVSPPDAVAATAVLQQMRIPKRIITILEGESLVNDASALVAYRFAVAAATAGTFSIWSAGGRFLWVGTGGVVVGYAVGWLVGWLRPRIREQAVESALSLLTPFFAYLPAEWCGVSGVLAVVTAGIFIGRDIPRITSPNQRLRLYGTWETLVFLLNGVIFILIGLQLPIIVGALKQSNHTRGGLLAGGALVTVAAILVRLGWVFSATFLVRRIFKKIAQRHSTPPGRQVFVVGWVGLRGIVSLAAALALPHGFPGRDYILFITFCVILGTLVFQGLTLPAVIRLLGLRGDDIDDREEAIARREATHAALARLEALSILGEATDEMIDRIRGRYKERLQIIEAYETTGAADEEARCVSDEQVRRQALTAEREMLILLRDDGTISDDVLRKVQHELDLDEARLSAESAD